MEIISTNDIEVILTWRKRVLEAVFGMPVDDSIIDANRDYFQKQIAAGGVDFLIAEVSHHQVACAAVCYFSEMPSPDNPSGLCAHIMNVYTIPELRRRGIAACLVHKVVDRALDRGYGLITLEATNEAKPLYKSLGFTKFKNVMRYERP